MANFIVIFILTLIPLCAYAKCTITFKSGKVINSDYCEEDQTHIYYYKYGSKIGINRKEVDNFVQVNDASENAFIKRKTKPKEIVNEPNLDSVFDINSEIDKLVDEIRISKERIEMCEAGDREIPMCQYPYGDGRKLFIKRESDRIKRLKYKIEGLQKKIRIIQEKKVKMALDAL
jgi:hypothetical protein